MNQLKLFFGAGALMMLASCAQKPADTYTVTGEVAGLDGQQIYLCKMIGDSMATDTATIENGQFKFEGTVAIPSRAIVYLGNLQDRANKQVVQFYVEPSEITISGLETADFSNGNVAGSKTTDEQNAYNNLVNPIYDELNGLRKAIQDNADNKELVDSLNKKTEELRAKAEEIQAKFIAENPGSFYVPVLLQYAMSQMSYDELKSVYESLTPEVQAAATSVKAELDALAAVQPGQPAPDLVGVNHKGEAEKLSDLKGKVVLVDFWATWCGPCRASLPHIQELYKKYHDKGFEVFCVGDNDSNPDQWKEFIETSKDGMQNYHHILRGLKMTTDANGNFTGYDKSGDQSNKYAVHYLPTKYLIAADGTIIGKFDDEELDAKLAEIFE